jgi:hypothetical protein
VDGGEGAGQDLTLPGFEVEGAELLAGGGGVVVHHLVALVVELPDEGVVVEVEAGVGCAQLGQPHYSVAGGGVHPLGGGHGLLAAGFEPGLGLGGGAQQQAAEGEQDCLFHRKVRWVKDDARKSGNWGWLSCTVGFGLLPTGIFLYSCLSTCLSKLAVVSSNWPEHLPLPVFFPVYIVFLNGPAPHALL